MNCHLINTSTRDRKLDPYFAICKVSKIARTYDYLLDKDLLVGHCLTLCDLPVGFFFTSNLTSHAIPTLSTNNGLCAGIQQT